jgi:hypothetical protein
VTVTQTWRPAVAVTRDRGGDHHGAAGVVDHADVRQDRIVEETVQLGPVGDRAVVHPGQCGVRHASDATGISGSFREPESTVFQSQYGAAMSRHARQVEVPI